MTTSQNTITYVSHKNSPIVDTLIIVQETEKAVKVKSFELSNYCNFDSEVWVPKSAFETFEEIAINGVKREYTTLKLWFRKKLSDDNNRNAKKVLGLLAI